MTRLMNLLVLTCLLLSASLALAEDQIPNDVRKALESAMQDKVSALLKEKDANGNNYKRASFSRFFKKVDESTYKTALLQDSVNGNQMKVERFEVTLKQKADNTWEIADQQLQEAFDKLYRGMPRDEKFYTFASFSFEREGLKVDVGPGALYTNYWNGKLISIRLASTNIKYDFKPPEGVKEFQQGHIYQALLKESKRKDDLVIEPEAIFIGGDSVSCDEILKTAFTGLADAKVEALPTVLRTDYDKLLRDSDERLKTSPFSDFRQELDPNRRTWTIAMKRKGLDRYFWMDYDTDEPWEVRIYASNMGGGFVPVLGYYSEETRKSGKSEWELEKREDSDSRDYEIEALRGTVELAMKDPEAMTGDLYYTINTKRDLNWMPFRISRNNFSDDERKENKNPVLIVNSLEDGNGRQLTWVRLGAFYGLVVFPEPVKAGTKLDLHMQFENQKCIYNLNYSYSAMDRGGWLPFVRFGDLIKRFEMTIKVPKRYTAIGIGKQISESVEGDVRVSNWKSSSPVSFPTVIFGEYIEKAPSKPLPKKRDGTEIPVMVHVDKVNSEEQEIRPGQLPAVGDQAVESMRLYAQIYGKDYPYDTLNLVSDPLGFLYGQSPASIIYLGWGVFRGEGLIGSQAGGGRTTRFNKDVVAHEVGHQWWGSLITNSNQRNYWFIESMAELSSALFVEKAYGRKAYLEKVDEWRQTVVERDVFGSVQNNYAVWNGGTTQALIYNKGPFAFHILRETFGDEKFFTFLRALGNLAGQEITTRDLQAVSEKVYGGDMNWFWDQWIRGVGMPEYKWTYSTRQTEDGQWLVEGKILQRVVVGLKKNVLQGVYYKTLIPIRTEFGSGPPANNPIFVEGPETAFRFKVASKPSKVTFAAEMEVLASSITTGASWGK